MRGYWRARVQDFRSAMRWYRKNHAPKINTQYTEFINFIQYNQILPYYVAEAGMTIWKGLSVFNPHLKKEKSNFLLQRLKDVIIFASLRRANIFLKCSVYTKSFNFNAFDKIFLNIHSIQSKKVCKESLSLCLLVRRHI